MKTKITFLIAYSIATASVYCQVIKPGDYRDGIYVKENTRRNNPEEKNAFHLKYIIPELLDSAKRKELKNKVDQIKQTVLKPPLKLDECVYFSTMMNNRCDAREQFATELLFSAADSILGNSEKFPPSMRFYTDSAKNKIDSLFNINLNVTVPLNEYLNRFYFKKTEITNAEYRQFVIWVRDSIARVLLAENGFSEYRFEAGEWHTETERLNWKPKINWDSKNTEYKLALLPLYLPEQERYYRRRELDTRKLNFAYRCKDHCAKYKDGYNVVNVYPDTLKWIHDFNYSETWRGISVYRPYETMCKIYFWKSEYDNYPVVGISWEQAQAYLCWKTRQEQIKLDAKKIKCKIEYALPSEIEWEIAASSSGSQNNVKPYQKNYRILTDNSWVCDLRLDSSAFVIEGPGLLLDSTSTELIKTGKNQPNVFYPAQNSGYEEKRYEIEKDGKHFLIYTKRIRTWSKRNNFLTPSATYNINAQADDYECTAPADLENIPKKSEGLAYLPFEGKLKDLKPSKIMHDNTLLSAQLDVLGISFMGGNVSEWLKNSYADWKSAFEIHLKMLKSVNSPDAQLAYQLEKYYDSFNATNGKLVRGGNWFDERSSTAFGKNPAGTKAKTFVDPEKSHSTLGFRYVVHVTQK